MSWMLLIQLLWLFEADCVDRQTEMIPFYLQNLFAGGIKGNKIIKGRTLLMYDIEYPIYRYADDTALILIDGSLWVSE